jgi:hypothetical protein
MADLTAIRWEGAFFNHHSLAHVNRELCLALLASGQLELSLISAEPPEFDPAADPRLLPLAERIAAPFSGPAPVRVLYSSPPRLDPPLGEEVSRGESAVAGRAARRGTLRPAHEKGVGS